MEKKEGGEGEGGEGGVQVGVVMSEKENNIP